MESLTGATNVDVYEFNDETFLNTKDSEEKIEFPKFEYLNNVKEISLTGRASLIQDLSSQNVDLVYKQKKGPSFQAQLQELFQSTERTQKLFRVDKSKIGIIFNPKREDMKFGSFIVGFPVVIVSNSNIPENILNQIKESTPEQYKNYYISEGSTFNGQSSMKLFGFE